MNRNLQAKPRNRCFSSPREAIEITHDSSRAGLLEINANFLNLNQKVKP